MTDRRPDDIGAVEVALRRLAFDYARAMDRRDIDLLDRIVTDDIVISGPGFRSAGRTVVLATPDTLRAMFATTRHEVHNQTIDRHDGDEAEGETYCTASHMLLPDRSDGPSQLEVWSIRYLDRFRRDDESWRFAERRLEIDWIERRTIAAD